MASNDHDEEKPFLAVETESSIQTRLNTKRLSWTRTHYILCFLHAVFLAMNAGLLVFNVSTTAANAACSTTAASIPPDEIEELYSPARSFMKHEIRVPDVEPKGPFVGLPRHELDAAWSDLLRPSMVNMPRSEMTKMNKTSIAVKDTDNYVGYYGVFHQLHCLKRLYQWTYKESYPDLIAARRLTAEHYDHCIEVIRQALICQPDLTVNTVHFDPTAPTGIKGYNKHERKCVKWEPFKEWVDQRAIPAPLEQYVVGVGEEGAFGP